MYNKNGLNEKEVEVQRQRFGENTLPESDPPTLLGEFINALKDPMIIILLIIATAMMTMAFIGYAEIYDSIGIYATIILVGCVTAKNNMSSDSKYRKLKASIKEDLVKVTRNGQLAEIPVSQVVVGDLVHLQSGDKVPADMYMVDGNIHVDNSAMNGEPDAVSKSPIDADYVFPTQITGDTFVDKSTVFRGTICVDGSGAFKVNNVGIETMMGKMATEMTEKEPDSPLKVKLAKLAKQISVFGYIGAIVISVLYMILFIKDAGSLSAYMSLGVVDIAKDILEAFSLAAVIVVCAVPEGLPLMIAIVLMQNTEKMLDHNVLVRKAIGIETAGSLSILFSDKTGTITKGHPEVTAFFTADKCDVPLDSLTGDSHACAQQFAAAAILTNESSFGMDGNVIGGNTTDRVLLDFVGKDAYDAYRCSDVYEQVDSQSFKSANKFAQAEVIDKVTGQRYTYYKGAPEMLLSHTIKYKNKNGDILDIDRESISNHIDGYANSGFRLLGFGYSERPMQKDIINDDLVILGFVAIRDDTRPEARTAIREVISAGVQVVMITGDRLETAMAIGKDVGLLTEPEHIAITSAELSQMSDDEVKEKIPFIRVIARAVPTDKSRMVRLCQEMNLVVGMTGDGVNDAPALKRADVGFAMGSGTDAAKEAGKIVIQDDNFNSIKDAIWYGRTIYNNILKFCQFQLTINVVAVIVSALAPFLGFGEPLKVTHLLFVNVVMDALGALMFGNEPALREYMLAKPRARDEKILSGELVSGIIYSAVLLLIISLGMLNYNTHNGLSDDYNRTLYFIMFITCALFNGVTIRDKSVHVFKTLKDNTTFVKIMLVIMAAQLCTVYIPGLNTIFGCTPVHIVDVVLMYVIALVYMAFVQVFKWMRINF